MYIVENIATKVLNAKFSARNVSMTNFDRFHCEGMEGGGAVRGLDSNYTIDN